MFLRLFRLFAVIVLVGFVFAAVAIAAAGLLFFEVIGGNEWLEEQRKRDIEVRREQRGYSIHEFKVEWGDTEVPGADPSSFVAFPGEEYRRKTPWGRDDQRAYYRQLPVPSSDPDTFEVLGHLSAKDKNYVYFACEGRLGLGSSVRIIEGADPSTYRRLECGKTADATHVFVDVMGSNDVIEHADPKSFRKFKVDGYRGGTLYRDDQYVFTRATPVATIRHGKVVIANANTWRRVSDEPFADGYFTDGVGVWHQAQGIKEADPATFKVHPKEILTDANRVWWQHRSQEVVGADPSTIQLLPEFCMKDASQVWCRRKILEDADPDTFEVLSERHFRDAQHVWYEQRILEGADPATIEVLSYGVCKDKNHAWYGRRKLENVDLDTLRSDGLTVEDKSGVIEVRHHFAK